MTAPDLKPCWHCGGEASPDGYVFYSKPCTETRWEDGSPITEAFFCNCPKCGVTNMTSGMGHRTRQQAIDHWNTRTTPLAEALAVVLDALKDGEVWGRAVNGASAVLNSGMPEEYWTRPKEIREALDAALRAIGEGRNG